MDNHSKHAIKLTDEPREKAYTDWSPDGRKIAFNSWDWFDRQNTRITVMDADGNNAFDLADGRHPSWSPDGQKIAFGSGGDWKDQICVIGVDGNGFEGVTRDAAIKGTPEWSPDGKRIAYMALNDETYQIYVIRADGRNPVRLTHKPEHHHMDPSWSPDGRLIAYMWSPLHLNPSPAKIHVMTADGESLKQLSDDHRGNEFYPDFGPVSLAVSPVSNKITVWGKLKIIAPNLRTR